MCEGFRWCNGPDESGGTPIAALIIRHRSRNVAPHQFTPRRLRITGEGILNDKAHHGAGIPVARDSLLLFLLAARAAILASDTRPVFAEGLASSYEAYLDTRLQSRKRATAAAIEEDEFDESDAPDCVSGWYLDRLTALAPRDEPTGAPSHPKVRATLDRTIKLWESGEK